LCTDSRIAEASLDDMSNCGLLSLAPTMSGVTSPIKQEKEVITCNKLIFH